MNAPGSNARTVRAPRTSGTSEEYLSDALFRQLDVNGDGELTGNEIPTELRGEVNDRGAIDAETFAVLFQARVQRLRGSQDPASGGAGQQATPAWFTALDPQSSGEVRLETWRAAGRDVAEFHRMDTDGDGVLTVREVQAFQAQPVAAANRPPRKTTDAAPADKPDAATPLSRADMLLGYYSAVAAGVPLAKATGGVMFTPTAPAKATTPAPTPAPAPAAPAPAKPAPAKPAAKPAPAPAKPTPPAPAPPAPPPPAEVATLPLPLTGYDYWVKRNNENLLELFAGERPNVLFLGDSITDLLATGAGKPVWDKYYTPLGSLDFAVSGVRTSHVLWQVETGQVAMAAPKVVVLLIGTNNLTIGHTPEETAAGITKIVKELGVQLPKTRILLLGILPRGGAADPYRAKVAKVNDLIANLEDDRVTYLDIGRSFLSPDRSLSTQVMPDGLHPSLLGYQLYTVAIWPTLTGLLTQP